MTEEEWFISTNPERMLSFISAKASARKLRYFVIACARSVLPDGGDTDMVEALAVAERFADGAATKTELTRARGALKTHHPARVSQWPMLYTPHIRSVPAWHATREEITRNAGLASRTCAWSSTRTIFAGRVAMTYPDKELASQAKTVRCIFGNPFRPVSFDPSWRTSTVVALAEGIYADRAFDRLPILADALEDAGCDHPDMLAHCRGPGPHARGCWVVDLVLDKS